jgi:uroporphyrinogen decarboxylase
VTPRQPFLDTLDGLASAGPPPVWLMRQAGRYLPEYREIRTQAPSFLEFCYTPRLAVEATLQPIRRFGFDAAILFSDILVVPDALGQAVSFETGHGPRLTPVTTAAELGALRETIDLTRLAPVFETVATLKARLPRETALIGFCGAPWTVASYMVAGRGTPDQAPARLLAYRDPGLFGQLIDRLVAASIDYLDQQCQAGVDAVQIFDSWAGVLPAAEYETWCWGPTQAIVASLRQRRPGVRIIGFPRVGGAQLLRAAETGVTALSLDTAVDPRWAHTALPPALPLQGNLDPLVLLAGGSALDEAVERIRDSLAGRPHVFNLGHGILPETPVPHVEQMLGRLRV